MADKLCTICLFLISSVKPNNEINGEYKTEDKNHKSFASNGYKQGCRETNLHGFPEETQRGRQMWTTEDTLQTIKALLSFLFAQWDSREVTFISKKDLQPS